jgi:hypothetical protein
MKPGDLVTVASGAAELDGLVFDTPNSSKAVVAIVDPARGPVLRTVDQKALTSRATEGPHDHALRLLVKRTPPPVHGAARGATPGGHGRSGHTRGASHRTTGR